MFKDRGWEGIRNYVSHLKEFKINGKPQDIHIKDICHRYYILWRVKKCYNRWKSKICKKLCNNTTFIEFDDVCELENPIIVIEKGNKWVFDRNELLNIYRVALENHIDLFHEPEQPKNPYTNVPFSIQQHISIFEQFGHITLPKIVQLFKMTNYNMFNMSEQFLPYIKEIVAINYINEIGYDTYMNLITKMINKYTENYCKECIKYTNKKLDNIRTLKNLKEIFHSSMETFIKVYVSRSEYYCYDLQKILNNKLKRVLSEHTYLDKRVHHHREIISVNRNSDNSIILPVIVPYEDDEPYSIDDIELLMIEISRLMPVTNMVITDVLPLLDYYSGIDEILLLLSDRDSGLLSRLPYLRILDTNIFTDDENLSEDENLSDEELFLITENMKINIEELIDDGTIHLEDSTITIRTVNSNYDVVIVDVEEIEPLDETVSNISQHELGAMRWAELSRILRDNVNE